MRKLASCVVLLALATSINSAIAGNIGIGSNPGAQGRGGAAAGMESDVQVASNASLSESSLSAALLIGVDFSADAGLF